MSHNTTSTEQYGPHSSGSGFEIDTRDPLYVDTSKAGLAAQTAAWRAAGEATARAVAFIRGNKSHDNVTYLNEREAILDEGWNAACDYLADVLEGALDEDARS